MNVFVAGGSAGIGLEIARECVRLGAKSVTIAARRQNILDEAVADLESTRESSSCVISSVPLDCNDIVSVQSAVQNIVSTNGSIDFCFSNVGYCKPATFIDSTVEEFTSQYATNIQAGVTVAKVVLPEMSSQATGGAFMFTSSMAGQVGLFGFGAYTVTKFGLRGLAEALAMEFAPHKVHVGVIYPPATKTPGFEEEQKTKPKATFEMEKGANAWEARDVAVAAVAATERAQHRASVGFDGHVLSLLTAGFGPVSGPASLLAEVLLASPLRLVAAVIRWQYNSIAWDAVFKEKQLEKKHKAE